MKDFQLHGEVRDVVQTIVNKKHELILFNILQYELKDVFNFDESGSFYQMTPDRTISPFTFSGRKSQKSRLTFPVCFNADVIENFSLTFFGTSYKLLFFQKKTGDELSLYYKKNKNVGINASIFYDWLHYINKYIGTTLGIKILLLMDNCSEYGTKEIFPRLDHFEVEFLPSITTSKIQPRDTVIIAAMKLSYERRQM